MWGHIADRIRSFAKLSTMTDSNGLDRYAYTYARRPVRLVWTEEFEDPTQAVAFERKLKGWSRAKKEAVIRGDWQSLPGLARRRSRPSDESPKPRGIKNQ